MQHLGGLLDTSVMTVSGKTLAENLAGYVYEYPEDPTIIKTVEEPFSKTGGVAVLHGNLCPRTAVSKPGAIDPSMHRFVGKASATTARRRPRRPSWAARSRPATWWSSATRAPRAAPVCVRCSRP